MLHNQRVSIYYFKKSASFLSLLALYLGKACRIYCVSWIQLVKTGINIPTIQISRGKIVKTQALEHTFLMEFIFRFFFENPYRSQLLVQLEGKGEGGFRIDGGELAELEGGGS